MLFSFCTCSLRPSDPLGIAVLDLYENGRRNFWIHNTGPLGCLPREHSIYDKKNRELDEHGCLKALNDVAREFNRQLLARTEELRIELEKSNIVYVDIYSIKCDLFSNAATYGFENPLMACCGNGGAPFNYNMNISSSFTIHLFRVQLIRQK